MAHVLVVGLDKGTYKEIEGYNKEIQGVSRKDEKVNKDIYHSKH